MTAGAILMMVLTTVTVTAFAVYFFLKMLRRPFHDSSTNPLEQQRKE